MAVSAREVILIFRGQNYLSSAIRQVGRDVGGLSRSQQLTAQRTQLQINGQRLLQTKAIAEAGRASVITGSRRLALDKARAQLSLTEQTAATKLRTIQEAQLANQSNLIKGQIRLEQLQRAQATRLPIGRGLARMTPDQITRATQAQQLANDRLMEQSVTLERQRETQLAAIGKQSAAAQQLAARETELYQREAQLSQRINTTSRAFDLNTEKLNQNAIAMRMLPWDSFQRGAQIVEHAGRVLQMFGLIAGAAFGYAADQAAKFQTAGTLAATQMITRSQNSVAQITRTGAFLSQQLSNFLASGKSVLSAQEAQFVAYQIPSGIPSLTGDSLSKARQTISILKELNQVVKANFGLVTPDQASTAAIILVNTFNTAVNKLPHAFDIIQSAVNRGKVTLGEFINGLSQTAPAARAAGYSLADMSGTLSFLSGKLPQYTRVATGYARSLDLFHNIKLQQFMKAQGESITDASGKLLSFGDIISRILKVDPSLATKRGNLIAFLKEATGTVATAQARRVLTPALEDLPGLIKASREIPANAAGLVNASATALSATGAVKWKELSTELKQIIIILGQGAIPAFQKLAKPIEGALAWFNKLSPGVKTAIGYLGAFVAVGALVGGTLLAIGGGIGVVVGGVGKMLEARGVLAGLGSEAGFIGISSALALGAPAAIIALIMYHKQVMSVINALGGLQNVLRLVVGLFVGWRMYGAITGLATLDSELLTSIGLVGGLRTALLGIAGLTVAATIIMRTVSNPGQTNKYDTWSLSGLWHGFGIFDKSTWSNLLGSRNKFADQQMIAKQAAADQAAAIRRQSPTFFPSPINPIFTRDIPKTIRSVLGPGATATPHIRSISEWITLLEKARTKMLGSPNDVQAAKQYEQLQINLNKQFKGQPALLSAINDVLSVYDSSLKKATNSTNTLGVTTQDVLSSLQTMYNNFLQQETSAFGTLFQGPFVNMPSTQNNLQFGGQLSGQDLIKDLRSQLQQFTTFHTQLNQLSKRGAPRELITQLSALGPAALKQIEQLNKLPSGALRGYFKLFQESQKAIHQQTMRDLNEQLAQYRKYGQNIALQIVAGLRDENVHVTNYLQKLITKMFPGLPTGATGAGDRPTHHRAPTHPTIQHTHYHVVAPKDNASVKAQVRHADFARRHKYSGRGPGTR